MNPVSTESLYVIATFGYWGDPSCDDLIYFSKDEAKRVADDRSDKYPTLKFSVMTLNEYIGENRDFVDR